MPESKRTTHRMTYDVLLDVYRCLDCGFKLSCGEVDRQVPLVRDAEHYWVLHMTTDVPCSEASCLSH